MGKYVYLYLSKMIMYFYNLQGITPQTQWGRQPHRGKKKINWQYLSSCSMFILKCSGIFFPFYMKPLHHNNHQGSFKKSLCLVPCHPKEASLSHSQGWHCVVLGSLPAGYISMSRYLLVSQNPLCWREASKIHLLSQGSSRDRIPAPSIIRWMDKEDVIYTYTKEY